MALQIYERLLQFPLFYGMSHKEVMELVAHYHLDFFKKEAEEEITIADAPCEQFIMLTKGQIESTTTSPDNSFFVEEVFNSPYTLQPENLFGTSQRFRSTFTTSTRCNFITIDKKELVVLFEKFETIRLNYLNMLSNMTQKTLRSAWLSRGASNRSHIISFMANHCLRPAGHKVFNIFMTRLAEEINTSRRDVSAELNKMQAEGLLELSRGRITVPFMERLITL